MSRDTNSRPNAVSRWLKMTAALVVLMAATVFATEDSLFDSKSSFSSATLDFVGFDPTKLSPEAQDGLREIFSGQMTYTPMPLSLSKAMDAAEAARKAELGYDPSTAKGKFYRSGSLPSPPTRGGAADVSVGEAVFERNGAMVKTGNCFACHAGVANGTVVAGLGNNSVMQGAPRPKNDAGTQRPNMMQLAADLEPAEKAALAEIMKIGSGVRNPIPAQTNRGDNYGPFGVWAHGAQLEDPETKGMLVSRAKTELTDVIENTMAPPVNPMPWWLMKYKTLDYWYGDGGPSDAAHFSFNFSSSHEKANELQANHVARTAKALTFARATVSPVFPNQLNAELVKKGADLFHDRTEPADTFGFRACYECHGTYTKIEADADFSKPGSWTVDYVGTKLRNVNTDSAYNEATHAMRPVADHITKLAVYFEKQGTPELAPLFDNLPGKGYLPPPLVGVWASGPYFHNGSVPTVEAVLNSKLRPEIWERNQDPYAYDLESIGMVFSTVTRDEMEANRAKAADAPYMSRESLDQMFVYDTTTFGRGNQGHRFGDGLTQDERLAIMEFLKSLSGPNMPPASPPGQATELAEAR